MRRLSGRLSQTVFGSAVYRRALSRNPPDRVLMSPPEPWPGDAKRGAAISRGEFHSAGDSAPIDAAIWSHNELSARWLADLHGFDWLADLQASGGDTGRRRARELITDWIAHNPPCRDVGWRPDILGRRVANWLSRFEFYGASADSETQADILQSLGAQCQHLARVAPSAAPGPGRILAAKGLIYSGLALPNGTARRDRGLDLLDAELEVQILGDGGHVSRDPSVHLAVLRHLIDIRGALAACDASVPETIPAAITRMSTMVRFFRMGDGHLALFNGGNEETDSLIDAVLTRSNARGKPASAAADSGYHRLSCGRTLVIMDAGAPPPQGFDDGAHAGTLSFEMSVGRERLIVNCGAYRGGDGSWRGVARATAAHSTAVVRNTNSSGILADGGLSRRPAAVTCRREEADGAVLLDASHDGYVEGFGLVHRRRLYLSTAGDDLRGEDTLAGDGWHDFALRFHLHPGIRASLVHDGHAVLLRLPGGDGWRFSSDGAAPELAPTVYMGERGRVQRSDQVVVAGTTEGGRGVVRWSLKRIPKKTKT
ncbi:MAG: hypothetical protein GY791_00300 [Alphaproteobacteria bacterium]|nr:hypothetical protein [Alphaproteobacteria bacterium]